MSAVYSIHFPEFRNSVPDSWRGFDLRGKGVGSKFFGCAKCGVQLQHCEAAVNQCPNCLGKLSEFTVTKEDVASASKVSNHGLIVE